MKRNFLKFVVCMMLIAAMLAAPMSASAASMAHIMKINVSDARLRVAPGDTEVIAKLRRSTKVLYWGEEDDSYCKIATLDGEVGYVFEDYLSHYGTVKQSMVYTNDSKISLYKKSGDSLKKSGSISADQLILVYKTSGDWAQIKTITGKSGYCKLSSLNKVF